MQQPLPGPSGSGYLVFHVYTLVGDVKLFMAQIHKHKQVAIVDGGGEWPYYALLVATPTAGVGSF